MSGPNTLRVDFLSESPERTRRLGHQLGSGLQTGDVVCLQGELGAGKTTLVQGLAQGWGSVDAVSSPTFILVNVYRRAAPGRLFHMDAYRLTSQPEAEELDLEAMLAEGALVIEWPERLTQLIPSERLWIRLEPLDEPRRALQLGANGTRYVELLEGVRRVFGDS